jgi:hypothetical protein
MLAAMWNVLLALAPWLSGCSAGSLWTMRGTGSDSGVRALGGNVPSKYQFSA